MTWGSWSASSPGCKTPSTAQAFKGLWAFSSELLGKYPTAFFLAVVQSLSHVRCFVNPWTAAHRAPLSFTASQSLLKLMSIESVMPSNQLILLLSIFPSIRVFSKESALCIRWPKYWSFRISSSSEYSGLISFKIDYQAKKGK